MKKTLKSVISLAIALSLCIQAFAVGSLTNFTAWRTYTPGLFTDVNPSAWYYENVKSAYELGLVYGATEDKFVPDRSITVAETIVLACRLHKIYNASDYEFVQGDPWYKVYVDYAVENGIASDPASTAFEMATRAYFATTLSNALSDEAFTAINSISSIPDVDYKASYYSDVLKLYNAGILTGSDSAGSFLPNSNIKRSEVAAIVTRMADPKLRKEFSLEAQDSSNIGYESILNHASPSISFVKDDGIMSILHCSLRLAFEQEVLPQKLFENKAELSKLITNDPEEFMAFIDNDAWSSAKNNILLSYMEQSEETYVFNSIEDLAKTLTQFSDDYSLYAYQSYECDAFKYDENTYCVLLNLADIHDSLKVPELYKLIISTYVAIVYEKDTDTFSYYLLERSLDDAYMLCQIESDMTHKTIKQVKNTKRAFIEAVYEEIK